MTGDRRQLTVMFCDLEGSTALSEQLDAEVLREVLVAYQSVAARAVQEFDGTIAQYLGDGVLVYFGFPLAHEDSPRRAIDAARRLVDSMEGLNDRLERDAGVRLGLHIGIHTGPVVVGQIGAEGRFEQAAVGETPNVAARLSDFSKHGAIVVSETTRRLAQGFFETEPLGALSIRGMSQPVAAHRVLAATGAASRIEAAHLSGLTPFVGREREVTLLLDRWQRVKKGAGQVVLLAGEAGMGKSRLVHVLRSQLAGESRVWLEGRCTPLAQHSALYPVIDLFRSVLGIERDDPPEAQLAKVEVVVGRHGLSGDAVALFAALLSIPVGEQVTLPPMTPQLQRQLTLDALLNLLLRVAEKGPMVLVVEDVQWVDPSTLEFLTLLVTGRPLESVLVVLTFRPEFRPPWAPLAHSSHLNLSRLTRAEVGRLVEAVSAGRALPAELTRRLVERVDGVPLFAEELTKSVIEAEAGGAAALHEIPMTLSDSLMARLDRLGAAKEVAQVAATLGRVFSLDFLSGVADLEEEKLHDALDRLVESGLVLRDGSGPRASYSFKHALVQDAAYHSLLRRQRREHHRRAADVLRESFPETAEARPELVAHHYTEAGRAGEAIPHWLRAGQMAFARSANQEAIAHLGRGIGLVAEVDEPELRVHTEIGLQTTLGATLAVTSGYAAPDVEQAFARARELAQHLGDAPEIFPILRGLSQFHEVRGEYDVAESLGELMSRLAGQTGNPGFDLEAASLYGQAHFWTGRVRRARELVGHAVAVYEPERHRIHAQLFGEDPGVRAHSYLGWILWMLGHPDQGLEHNLEALRLAEEAPHPFTLCLAHNFAAAQHQLRGEIEKTRERAAAAFVIATEQGFPFWAAMGRMYHGWALARSGQPEEGVRELESAIEAWRAIGCRLGRPNIHGLLADARWRNGDRQGAIAAVEMAIAMMDETDERFLESHLIRLRAELRYADGAPDAEVERELRRALAIAEQRGLRSLELRAATSLGRLLGLRGARAEARGLVIGCYEGFSEGFDTADLEEARQLLAELAA